MKNNRRSITRNCQRCQAEFEAALSEIKRGDARYCSRRCGAGRKPTPKVSNAECGMCRKQFCASAARLRKTKSGILFCSKLCHQEAVRSRAVPEVVPRTWGEPGQRYRPPKELVCEVCDRTYRSSRQTTICSSECKERRNIQLWLAGEISGSATYEYRTFVKRYLLEKNNRSCEHCGFNTPRPDGSTILQVDHIDGNHLNNVPENLRLLCPNCHAFTDTFGSKNNGNGRAYRSKYKQYQLTEDSL